MEKTDQAACPQDGSRIDTAREETAHPKPDLEEILVRAAKMLSRKRRAAIKEHIDGVTAEMVELLSTPNVLSTFLFVEPAQLTETLARLEPEEIEERCRMDDVPTVIVNLFSSNVVSFICNDQETLAVSLVDASLDGAASQEEGGRKHRAAAYLILFLLNPSIAESIDAGFRGPFDAYQALDDAAKPAAMKFMQCKMGLFT